MDNLSKIIGGLIVLVALPVFLVIGFLNMGWIGLLVGFMIWAVCGLFALVGS